jgi:hypothetical protein
MVRVALVAAALGCVTSVAAADPRKDAGEHFARAEAAQSAGKYREAIAEYEAAYAIAPHPDTLYNIAASYEKLQDWRRAIEYYERYLDERDAPAPDAADVKAKIAQLRSKLPANATEPPAVAPPPTLGQDPGGPAIDTWGPPQAQDTSRWHAGFTYGVGFGDAPVERYVASAGLRFGERLDGDVVLGLFGRNDKGAGVQLRLQLMPDNVSPFLRGMATIGYAKQDSSSSAGTKFPISLEVGGGLQLARLHRGRLDLGAVVRFTRGGFDAQSTTADSHINDEFAFAIDLGFSFDFAAISAISNGR